MIAPRAVLDTNVVLRYRLASPGMSLLVSAVVLQELAAGAPDDSALQAYDVVRRNSEAEGRLLVPTGEDWLAAGKILSFLLRGASRAATDERGRSRRRSNSGCSVTC